MNVYTTQFGAKCPNNGKMIWYTLRIERIPRHVLMVEDILEATMGLGAGYHEALADSLHAALGGRQTLTAEHHGVTIETVRA